MKKLLLRFVVYLCSFVVFVGGVGAFGYFRSQKDFYGSVRQEPVPSLQGIKQPEYDPNNLRLPSCWGMKPRKDWIS